MQCAREAEMSCDRPATPIPAWTSDAQVLLYLTHPVVDICTYIQGELKTLLSQHPPTATTLNAVKQLLSQQSLVFDVDLGRWLVVLVTDLALIGDVALTSAMEVVIMLTKLLLVSLNSNSSGTCT